MTMNEYPEWQQLIRQAQHEQRDIEANIAKQEAESKRQADEEKGQRLATVLRYFGIVSTPKDSTWEIDGYLFQLVRYEEMDKEISFTLQISSAQARPWSECDVWRFGERYSKHLDKKCEFELQVPSYQRLAKDGKDLNWRRVRSQFADALDKSPQRYKEAVAEWAAYLSTKEQEQAAPTAEQNLINALMEILYQQGVRLDG